MDEDELISKWLTGAEDEDSLIRSFLGGSGKASGAPQTLDPPEAGVEALGDRWEPVLGPPGLAPDRPTDAPLPPFRLTLQETVGPPSLREFGPLPAPTGEDSLLKRSLREGLTFQPLREGIAREVGELGSVLQGGFAWAAGVAGKVAGDPGADYQLGRAGDLLTTGEAGPPTRGYELLESVGQGAPPELAVGLVARAAQAAKAARVLGRNPRALMEATEAYSSAIARGGAKMEAAALENLIRAEEVAPAMDQMEMLRRFKTGDEVLVANAEGRVGRVTGVRPDGGYLVDFGGKQSNLRNPGQDRLLLAKTRKDAVEELASSAKDAGPAAAPVVEPVVTLAETAPVVATATGVPVPVAATGLAAKGRSFLNWVSYGRKGVSRGSDFAKATQEVQAKMGNVRGLAESEAAKVRNAFAKVAESPQEAFEAVADNLYYGTPVPEAVKEKFGDALPPLRRSLSELQELRRELDSLDPDAFEQYPLWIKRFWKEGEEKSAKKGYWGGGGGVGMPTTLSREDAFWREVSLSPDEVEGILAELPENLRPRQAAAAGISKGTVADEGGTTLIAWPNTPEGEAGRAAFEDLAGEYDKMVHPTRRGNLLRGRGDPIRPQTVDDAGGPLKVYTDKDVAGLSPEEAIEGALTPINDMPTILSRSWGDVLRRKAYGEYFRKLTTMTDDAGAPLTRFVSNKDLQNGQVPDGFVTLMEGRNRDRKWGILNYAEDADGNKGLYAVREDVASYLKEQDHANTVAAGIAHDFLDSWAIDATNAPKSSLANWLFNKVVVDTMNGVPAGSKYQKSAQVLVREWEQTGEIPDILKRAMEEGMPLSAPDAGLSSVNDEVQSIFERAGASSVPRDERFGAQLYAVVSGSPLAAKNPLPGAIGGGLNAGARALAEGAGPVGAAVEAGLGATMSTVMRPVARGIREKYVNSDLFSTVASLLKKHDDALAAGLNAEDAMRVAVQGGTVKGSRVLGAIDTTQSGLWHKVGGLSETLGAAPSGLAGRLATGVRAIQKSLLNRFLKWQEVYARMGINAARSGWKPAVAFGLGSATLYGVKEGGRKAAEALGILSPEEADFVEKNLPDSTVIPFPNLSGGMDAIAFPSGSFNTPMFDYPDEWRDVASDLAGPATNTGYEALSGTTIFTGGPVERTERQEGTKETWIEAQMRQNQGRWNSPWALTGRVGNDVLEMAREARGEAIPGRTSPSARDIALTPFLGRTRKVVPEELRRQTLAAWNAEKNEIEAVQGSAFKGSAKSPATFAANQEQKFEKMANLAERYLKRGLKVEELGIPEPVRAVLRKRGVLNEDPIGPPGLRR